MQGRNTTYIASIVLSSNDAIEGLSLDGHVLFWNKGTEELYGYSEQEILDKSILTIYPEERTDELTILITKIKHGKPIKPYLTQRKKKDGEIIDVVIRASPIKDKKGGIIGMSIISRPFTGQERLSRYARTLIEASLDPFITISPEGKITDVNEATIQTTGVRREQLIDSDFSRYFTEPEHALELYKSVYSKGSVTNFPLAILHELGKTIDVLCNASVYRDEQGNVRGVFVAARDITSQKAATQYARSLIEASLDPLVTISPEGKITDVNEATTFITGINRDQLIGTDFSNYFTEPDNANAAYKEVFEKGFITNYPLTIRNKEGRLTDVLYNASLYKDDKGNVLGVFAQARDITQQKQASLYAQSLIEASLDPLVMISEEGKITDVNEATIQVTGVPREKLIGSDFSNYFTEPNEAREGYKQAFKEGFVRDYPLAIRHDSGSITDVLYNATVYRDIRGKPLGVFSAARDITQRKRVEQELHAASAYSRSLIEASLDPMIIISPEGKITDVNRSTETLTGVTREWLIGSEFSSYFTETWKAREGYRLVLKEGLVRDFPLAVRNASGKVIDVLYNGTVFRNAKGKIEGVFASVRDITEIKKASQYARSLIEASLDPLFVINTEGKITDVNNAAINMTGLTRDSLIGSDLSHFFTEPEKIKASYNEVFKKGFISDYELTIRHKDGKLTHVLYNASVYKDENGKELGVLAAARDYTRIKVTSEKLEMINQELDSFTYSVAHDLKAPLRAMQGYSKVLTEDYSDKLDQEGQRVVSIITANAHKMIKLIEDLLTFSHVSRAPLHKEIIDMSFLANTVYKELKDNVPDRNITFKVTDVVNIKADNDLIKQVWINLLSNAIKFTQTKKQANIEVGSTDEGTQVTYFVKDNGIGFDMKYIDKLFGVFQRLHGQEFEGTGLGLANVKRIINRLGGKVWAKGNIGEGATFFFSLPKE